MDDNLDLTNNDGSFEEHLNAPVAWATTSTELATDADALRARLDGLYSAAFLHLKPVAHVRVMKKAMALHVELADLTGDNLSFNDDVVARTGLHLKTVQRIVSRAEGIDDAVLDFIDGTRLDRGGILDRLKHIPRDKQMEALSSLPSKSRASQTDAEAADVFLDRFDTLPTAVRHLVLAGINDRMKKGLL